MVLTHYFIIGRGLRLRLLASLNALTASIASCCGTFVFIEVFHPNCAQSYYYGIITYTLVLLQELGNARAVLRVTLGEVLHLKEIRKSILMYKQTILSI